jgi:hypothetical protein
VGAPANYSSEVRREARGILSQPPFTHTASRTPAPFAGVLHAIGHGVWWLIGHPLSWLWHHGLLPVFREIHGGLGNWWPVPAIAVALAVGGLAAWLLLRRRARIAAKAPPPELKIEREDPAELERAAAGAEQRGELELAVRLRYRAGLNRLEAKGIISNRFSRTDGQLRLAVRDPLFDDLADRHQSITYGSQPASPGDVEMAKDAWPKVLSGPR